MQPITVLIKNTGILAGQIKGESVITDVTVEGTAAANTSSGGYASDAAVGGLAGKISGSNSGSRTTIENVTATVNTVNLGACFVPETIRY